MTNYIPSPTGWVADQVKRIEETNGAEGMELRGLPVVLVTNRGRKTGAIRKTPLMRVADGDNYVLVASKGGAPDNPVWYYNLLADPDVTVRDRDRVIPMRVRLVTDAAEKARLWKLAAAAFPPYDEYQQRTERQIPVFLAEPR
jgi:F420H(2)-dependent quinone reductase